MKHLFNCIFLVLFVFAFSGCEIDKLFKPSNEEMALKNKALDAKIELDNKQLNTQKELELAKINNQLEKEKLQLKTQSQQNEHDLQKLQYSTQAQLQANYLLFAGLVACIIAVALFVYFNNRRKDKLKAYEDNLEKYFRSKENEAKVQVANKIIDTIASGKLNAKQESRLLGALNQEAKVANELLDEEEPVMELEIIEQKEKKKKKKKRREK